MCISWCYLFMSGPLHQGTVAPNCSEVSQLGPGNTYFKCHILGLSTHKIISAGLWANYGWPHLMAIVKLCHFHVHLLHGGCSKAQLKCVETTLLVGPWTWSFTMRMEVAELYNVHEIQSIDDDYLWLLVITLWTSIDTAFDALQCPHFFGDWFDLN